MLKLMYITNDSKVAEIAQSAGVDRIFVDMEYIGKSNRQGGMDTVQSHHTVEDVKNLRKVVTTSELLVRVNPWHEATDEYSSSVDEINAVIDAGADIIMLPYFKTVREVKNFLDVVDHRARTMLLVETCSAVEQLEEILKLEPDEIHIGINDLSLCKGKKFMFEMYEDGSVEHITTKCHEANIPVGIGGFGAIGRGLLPSNYIIREHYRLGSSYAILSRSFCNTDKLTDYEDIEVVFTQGVKAIRELETKCQEDLDNGNTQEFIDNKQAIDILVRQIARDMK